MGISCITNCREVFAAVTNKEMLEIAMKQSAEDIGCEAADFLKEDNVVVSLRLGENARKYYKLPISCNFVSYGNNIVAAGIDDVSDIVAEFIGRYEFYHCFETPNMHWLNDRLVEKGHKICFMAEYYLYDINKTLDLSCAYETRILDQADFTERYLPEWSKCFYYALRHEQRFRKSVYGCPDGTLSPDK